MMRYHYEKPDIYLSMYGKVYFCDHPVYHCCTLFQIGEKGLAVIQQRFDEKTKSTWWGEVDPWITDDLYLHPRFKEYFDKAGSFLQILCLILWSFLGVAVSVLILSFIMYPFSLFGIGGKIISFLLIIAGLIFIYNVSSLIFIKQAHRKINVSSREVFFETIKESFKNFFSLCAYIFYISIPVIIIAIITAIAVFSLYGNEAGHILKDVIKPAVNILVQPFIYYYYCFMLTKFYLDFIKKEGGI